MADDGLVLNFSVGDGPLLTKSAVKGGSWRARRRVHLMQRAGQRQSERGQRSEEERPIKRQRVESASERHYNTTDPTASRPSQHHHSKGEPKQVISSLFSYNPRSVVQEKPEDVPADAQELQPSNAPLTDEQLNFTTLGLSPLLATHLTNKLGVTAPTAIQNAAIPKLLDNDADAFLQAETGSGKTLAYVLPIVQRLTRLSAALKDGGDGLHRNSGLFAIVLTPTRELSKQVSVVLDNVLRCAHWLVAGSVIGGEKKSSEKARLRKGVNILVATPGRLADHLDHTTTLDVSQVRWLILDEGDRLMELGFEDDLQKIINKLNNRFKGGEGAKVQGLPAKRINVLCSATMRMDVQKLGEMSLRDAVHIHAAGPDGANPNHLRPSSMDAADSEQFSAPAQLKQSYIVTPAKLRMVTLAALLRRTFARKGSAAKAIVFISCADSVDFHFGVLSRGAATRAPAEEKKDQDSPPRANEKRLLKKKYHGKEVQEHGRTWAVAPVITEASAEPIYVYRLHGSLPQALRTTTLKSFTTTASPSILLCTDVASRGLDLPDIDLVVEYDPSFSKEDHLHRIGRTARAGKDGRATIFLMPGCEESYVQVLKDERAESGALVAGHKAEDHLKRGFAPSTKGEKSEQKPKHSTAWTEAATEWQLEIERWCLSEPRLLEQARRAYQSHIRAYATHIASERHIFDIKELHLGHLAKAFGLRDKPGSINVPGLRQGAAKVKSDRHKAGRGAAGHKSAGDASQIRKSTAGAEDLPSQDTSLQDAARRMRLMSRKQMGGASEFNLA